MFTIAANVFLAFLVFSLCLRIVGLESRMDSLELKLSMVAPDDFAANAVPTE
jgi:hypothetical protein